ncbi:4'-phosphopantetheinyl transferase family protein [Rhodoligotrophos defluvii]|uniref:4'-phosphopantetheinyl transferase family protein n=1 Tax=Rhodoligotrophos defluvii TaxID=2561934 RepID=UPI0010C9CED6|nr:4'-phosphopantetheinyl transferase superfamily protein [Rhodoligotrophos defluvii]
MTSRLDGRDAHLWQFETTCIGVEPLLGLLTDDEQARAERFRRAEDRARFVIGRAMLRQLLGRYLDRAPGDIHLHTTDGGKPVLPDMPQLSFSVSHSGGHVVLALSRAGSVGIDVERVRDVADLDSMIGRCFSTRERALIDASAGNERLLAFFRAWTRKEAFLKMLGTGLVDALDQIDCSPCADRTLQVSGPQGCARLAWHEYQPSLDHIAALVCENPDIRVSLHRPGWFVPLL